MVCLKVSLTIPLQSHLNITKFTHFRQKAKSNLTLSKTSPGFYVSTVQAF